MSLLRTYVVLCVGCGSVADSDSATDDHTCDPLGTFTALAPLPGFNTTANEGVARLTRDELTMYFSGMLGSSANPDLYAAARMSADRPFGAPNRLAMSSDAGTDYDPAISPDSLSLTFSSNRDGTMLLYTATRASTTVSFGTPSLVTGIVSGDANETDFQPFVTSDGQELWFSSVRPGGLGGPDIWRATRSGATFAPPVLVGELSSPANDALPVLSYDGLTVYFTSDRPGSNGRNIWRAHRSTVRDGFGAPQRVVELAISSDVYASWISPDNCHLYLAPTINGNTDIYLATRSP